jgi:Beta-lactamase
VGHADPYPVLPLYEPMTAAGGLYTSAADLARFLRFQLGDGSIDGRVVLDSASMKEMRTVPAPHAHAPAGAALGVFRTRRNRWDERPDLFTHGGGGFGFFSDVWWLPQIQVGIAILTNSQDHRLQGDLALSILADLLTEPGVYRERLLALPWRAPVVDPSSSFEPPAGLARLVADAAMAPTRGRNRRWTSYSGRYRMPAWGVLDPVHPPDRFTVESGVPYFVAEDETHAPIRHRLAEVEPGLFLADTGETLDLRGRVPRWGSLRLVRVAGGPLPWQWAIQAAAGTVAVLWLAAAGARALRRRCRRSIPVGRTVLSRCGLAAAVSTLTAVVALGSVALVVAVPGIVDSGFLGRLELPTAVRLVLHLPLVLTVLAACTVVMSTWGWLGLWWSRAVRLQYVALAIAVTALVAQLAAWRMIGWGPG